MKPTQNLITATEQTSYKPEFYRVPQRGGDPYFGFSRSYYYDLEVQGKIKLVRIRNRGNSRGVTLIPYDQVAVYIKSQMEEVL